MTHWPPILLSSLLLCTAPVQAAELQNDLLTTVKGFYRWALAHKQDVYPLAPAIRDSADSDRFYLDVSSLPAFIQQFMTSGYFSARFPATVERYYQRHQAAVNAYTPAEFAQMAADGRGPLLEVEDMDIFFCAQEYDWTSEFIDNTRLLQVSVQGDTATATVESTYQWQTTFHFHKESEQWRISGYCVFE